MEKKDVKKAYMSLFHIEILQELLFSGLGCLTFIIIVPLFPNNFWSPIYRTTFILVSIILFLLLLLILNQENPKRDFFKINYERNIVLYSIFNFILLYFLFYETSFGINGVSGDNFYRSAYITQMAYSGYPHDYAYKGLSAAYAPLYWYGLALIARFFHIKPFKMIKIGFLLSYYMLPPILYEVWKKIYNKKTAFLISIFSILFFFDVYALDHIIAALFFIPFLMYYFENCTNKEFTKKDYIWGGFIGSIIFCTYFYYFIIIPVYYLISFIQNKNKFKANLKHIFYLIISLSLFSSWFWIPLLRDILIYGFESHQQNYFTEGVLFLPFIDYFAFTTGSIILILGLTMIIKNYSISIDLRVLGNIIVSVYILFIIGLLGILINHPIMHPRFYGISIYALIISSSIINVKFLKFLISSNILAKYMKSLNIKQTWIYLLIFILSAENARIYLNLPNFQSYKIANKQSVPEEEIEIFEELDYEDKVFLTNEWQVAAFIRIYLFLLPSPYYNHPSALYNERVQFLVELAESETPKEFHKKIITNRFGPIDYFYLDLEDNATKLVLEVPIEKFPEGREYYDIEFKRELFMDDDLFEEIEIKDRIIYETIY